MDMDRYRSIYIDIDIDRHHISGVLSHVPVCGVRATKEIGLL